MRWTAVAIALIAAATACGPASDNDATSELCHRAGVSSVCLLHEQGGVEVKGNGFQPGSEVQVDVADGAGQLVPVADDGTFPAHGRTVGFLPGLSTEWHRLDGVDKAGKPVTYTVTCAVDAARQPRCAF